MLDERSIKEAFERVKQDIFSLGGELNYLREELLDLRTQISILNTSLDSLKTEFLTNSSEKTPKTHTPTDSPQNSTIPDTPTHNPTVPCEIGGLKYQNLGTSTGNRGVPTDRQTNQQTDNSRYIQDIIFNENSENAQKTAQNHAPKPLNQSLVDASEVLGSLDAIKKEIRLKFKSMTQQEMLVFSTIYQLEEQYPEGVEYRQIAQKLELSESSIRDYTQKLISKGIPVDKIKLNNKKILLKISSNLKSLAPLSTILKLREL